MDEATMRAFLGDDPFFQKLAVSLYQSDKLMPEMNDEIGYELFANLLLTPSEVREQKRRKS